MPTHRNPYVQDESEGSCTCVGGSPFLSNLGYPVFPEPEASTSSSANQSNRTSAGSMTAQVDDGFDDAQLHGCMSNLAIPESGYGSEDYSSPERQRILAQQRASSGQHDSCYGCGDSIPISTQRQKRDRSNTTSSTRGSRNTSIDSPSSSTPKRIVRTGSFQNTLRTYERLYTHSPAQLQKRNEYLEKLAQEYKEMWMSAEEETRWQREMLRMVEGECRELKREVRGLVREMERSDARNIKTLTEDKFEQCLPKSNGKGKEVVRATKEGDDRGEGEVLEKRFFYFYPQTSTIVLPGLPARILRFPRNVDLPGIHDFLSHQFITKNEKDEAARIVRKIMDANVKLGIQLPDNVHDQAIVISLPEDYEDVDVDVNKHVKIAAWRVTDTEDGYVEIVPWKYEEMPVRPKPTQTSVSRPHNGVHQELDIPMQIPDLTSFLCPHTHPSPSPSPLPSPPSLSSTCSCALCVHEFDPQTLIRPPIRPLVSVRGGADDDDDYDDYYDDDGDEFYDDYGYDNEGDYDSGDEDYDEEVEHEDEAHDPFDDGW